MSDPSPRATRRLKETPAKANPKQRNRPDAPYLPYGRQWIDEDDIAAVVEVLRSDFVTTGPAVPGSSRRCASMWAYVVPLR